MNKRIVRGSSIRVLATFFCIGALVPLAAWASGSQDQVVCREPPPINGGCVMPSRPLPRPGPEQESYEINLQATAAYAAGDYAGAENLFARALQKTPTDPKLLRNISRSEAQLGIGAYNRGDYTTALAYFQKGLSNDPADDPYTNHFRSFIALSQGKISGAEHAQLKCAESVPLATLIAHPDAYDGKKVWVVASVNVEFENMTACPSENQYPEPKTCLWLSIDDGPYSTDLDVARERSKFQRWQQFNHQTVAIQATFGKNRDGHLRTWLGSIRDATEVQGSEGGWSFVSNAAVPGSPCADAPGVPKALLPGGEPIR